MPFVDVVHVIVVRNGHMPAVRPVLMVVARVRDMRPGDALVHVITMDAMQAAVMNVVGVITMRDRHVPAACPMLMSMICVLTMLDACGHFPAPCDRS